MVRWAHLARSCSGCIREESSDALPRAATGGATDPVGVPQRASATDPTPAGRAVTPTRSCRSARLRGATEVTGIPPSRRQASPVGGEQVVRPGARGGQRRQPADPDPHRRSPSSPASRATIRFRPRQQSLAPRPRDPAQEDRVLPRASRSSLRNRVDPARPQRVDVSPGVCPRSGSSTQNLRVEVKSNPGSGGP